MTTRSLRKVPDGDQVHSSAAEAELRGAFNNCKEACPLRTALEELGHPQHCQTTAIQGNTRSIAQHQGMLRPLRKNH